MCLIVFFYSSNCIIDLGRHCLSFTLKGSEDNDWSKAEDLVKTGNRGEVELISSSTRGFVVSTL